MEKIKTYNDLLEKIKNEGKGILTVDRIKYIVDNVSNELLDTPAGASL